MTSSTSPETAALPPWPATASFACFGDVVRVTLIAATSRCYRRTPVLSSAHHENSRVWPGYHGFEHTRRQRGLMSAGMDRAASRAAGSSSVSTNNALPLPVR